MMNSLLYTWLLFKTQYITSLFMIFMVHYSTCKDAIECIPWAAPPPYTYLYNFEWIVHKNFVSTEPSGTWSVQSFNGDYVSIPSAHRWLRYLFHEIPGRQIISIYVTLLPIILTHRWILRVATAPSWLGTACWRSGASDCPGPFQFWKQRDEFLSKQGQSTSSGNKGVA